MIQENITHVTQLEDFIVHIDEETQKKTDIVHYLCNIHKNSLMTFSIYILDNNLYQENLTECSTRIQEFKLLCEQKAKENGIDVI